MFVLWSWAWYFQGTSIDLIVYSILLLVTVKAIIILVTGVILLSYHGSCVEYNVTCVLCYTRLHVFYCNPKHILLVSVRRWFSYDIHVSIILSCYPEHVSFSKKGLASWLSINPKLGLAINFLFNCLLGIYKWMSFSGINHCMSASQVPLSASSVSRIERNSDNADLVWRIILPIVAW